jgi:hypothetical protein
MNQNLKTKYKTKQEVLTDLNKALLKLDVEISKSANGAFDQKLLEDIIKFNRIYTSFLPQDEVNPH